MQAIEIGRLLRASTTGFIFGCRVTQLNVPSFGALVRVPLPDGYQIYGLIYDIHIDDDGLVRQLHRVPRDLRGDRPILPRIRAVVAGDPA